ncbi:hypothetical protein B7494_g5566 [Chlorociboria aeruginascens]|nr:hypothetical protein B7494_g5566 [Chlorociboria aeruginascens]
MDLDFQNDLRLNFFNPVFVIQDVLQSAVFEFVPNKKKKLGVAGNVISLTTPTRASWPPQCAFQKVFQKEKNSRGELYLGWVAEVSILDFVLKSERPGNDRRKAKFNLAERVLSSFVYGEDMLVSSLKIGRRISSQDKEMELQQLRNQPEYLKGHEDEVGLKQPLTDDNARSSTDKFCGDGLRWPVISKSPTNRSHCADRGSKANEDTLMAANQQTSTIRSISTSDNFADAKLEPSFKKITGEGQGIGSKPLSEKRQYDSDSDIPTILTYLSRPEN